jgi:hypothetical protein
MTERQKSEIEIIGDRCLEVVKEHANDTAPSLRLIGHLAWALGITIDLQLTPIPETQTVGGS